MKLRARVSTLWSRYLAWRNAEGVAPAAIPEPRVNKLAIDEADVATITTSNFGSGQAY